MDQFPQHPGQQPLVFAHPGESHEESAFDFWGVLSRRKWLVFLGLISGMALGAIYDAQCPDVYRSQAKVRIEPKDPMMIFQGRNSSQILPGAEQMAIRHDQLIGQPNIVKKCLTENGLNELPSFENIPEAEKATEVVDHLEITQNKEEVMLYDLVYYSSREDDAQIILNNLIATYEQDLEDNYKDESEKVETLIKTLNNDFKTSYQALQDEKRNLLAQHSAPDVSPGVNAYEAKVHSMGIALDKSKSLLSSYSQDLTRAKDVLNQSEEQIKAYVWILQNDGKISVRERETRLKDEKMIELARATVHSLILQRQELSLKYGPGHKQIQNLDGQIKYYQDIIDKGPLDSAYSEEEKLEPIDQLRNFVVGLEQKIADEKANINTLIPEYNKNMDKATKIATNEQQVEAVETAMADVRELMQVTKEKLIDIDSSGEGRSRHQGFRFATLMNATYGEPVWPILPLILGIGAFMGSLVGFGLGCLVELADKTFHNPDEIMKQLNVPLIGHVPVIGQSKRYLIENSLIDPIVCTYHRPKSQVSEAFRAVRTALYFNTQGKQHSVIQVTSPTPGDGKSTLASNLAVSIAQSGKRVLMVDSDMRRPRQHATFGIESKEGFATVLSGHSQWRDVVYECEEIEGLTVMPCGAKPNNPAELSSSPQVKELIEEMRQEFDFIIIDTPPLLAVTDPCPIAARVDGVIICLRIKKNVRVSAGRAIEMIGNLGANCIGLVVNGVGAQSGYGSQYTYGAYRAGYSYNGYGYGYGYGNGKYYDEDKRGRQAQAAPKHIEVQPAKNNQNQVM